MRPQLVLNWLDEFYYYSTLSYDIYLLYVCMYLYIHHRLHFLYDQFLSFSQVLNR